ncbi:MAG: winged helix-turn-helix transcriptional regulator [Thermoplasmatota archaeon]
MSNRLHLTCAFLALLLAPIGLASEPDAEEMRDEAEATAGAASEHVIEFAYEHADDARDRSRHEIAELREDAGEAAAEAERHHQFAVDFLNGHMGRVTYLLDGTVEAVMEELGTVEGEAKRRIPALYQHEGNEEAPSADASIAPSAQNAAPLDIKEPLLLVSATAAAAGILFWLAGSTGAAKAGTAATSTMAGKDLRKLLPYASPLFTRFERDTVLGHPKRESLYAEIMSNPGVTLQDLCEETGLSRTAVSHHLRLLEQQHLIVSKRVGRSRHFFENGGRYGRDQKDAYAVLHNDRSKDVHAFISEHPGAIQKDLCEALGIQASVAHWHVKRLQEANLLESVRQGRTVSYFATQAAYA